MQVSGGLSDVGWYSQVPPNGFADREVADPYLTNDNPLGLATPENEIETTPEHRNLIAGDPGCRGWTRAYDDPNVVALRRHLSQHNGIRGLEVVGPDEIERATRLFHRDGFVAVRDVLSADQLLRIKAATEQIVSEILAADPIAGVGGGAGGLPHRYSCGGTSASRHMLHRREWNELIDLPTTTPLLESIFGSANFVVSGGGGDFALPGAIEYQGLHSDNMWSELADPTGRVTMRDVPTPVLTANFTMCDLTTENGPIRQIPGTHRSRSPIPRLVDEPEWMKLSTVCPLPAGSAILRDIRAWHGGTPNLSREVRSLPNIEYFAPWFRSEAIMRCMPYDEWRTLSPHGQRISRLVVLGPGEDVVGAGFTHPRRAIREAHQAAAYSRMGEQAAAEYQRRM